MLVVFQNNKKNESDTVLFSPQDVAIIAINGKKVHKQEYLLHLKKEIAMTYNHFYLKYGVNNHPDFWTTVYGNTTPIDYLKNRTDKNVANSKIIHALAIENHVISNFEFNKFVKQWKDYNKKRKAQHASGEAVFGQVNTSISDYYFYLLSNLNIRVSDKIKKEKFSANSSTLKKYYETIKQEKFSYVKKAEIEQFGFPYEAMSYKKAIAQIEEINNKVLNKLSLCCELREKYPNGIFKKHIFYDSIAIYGEDNPDQIIKKTGLKLEYGKTKMVRTQEGVYLITLMKPLKYECYPYEKVKDLVLEYYQKEQYNAFLKQLKEEVSLDKNNRVYDKLSSKFFK